MNSRDPRSQRLLDEIQQKLASFEVFQPEEVEAFHRVSQATPHEEDLVRYVKPALERFAKLYEQPQREFQETLAEYVHLYPLLATTPPPADARLEGLFALGRFLLTQLPRLREPKRWQVAESTESADFSHTRRPRSATQEAELERAIRRKPPSKLVRRFRELVALRQAEALQPGELRELIRLTERLERMNVERLERLSELAGLRHLTLGALMDDLGIRPLPQRSSSGQHRLAGPQ